MTDRMSTVAYPEPTDAEFAVLALAVTCEGKAQEICSALTASQFRNERHRQIFRAISDLAAEGESVNIVTAYHRCLENGVTVSPMVFAEMQACLLLEGIFPSHLQSYLNVMLTRAAEDILHDSLSSASHALREDGIDAVIASLQEANQRIKAHYRSPVVRLEDQVDAVMRPLAGVETGFHDIDRLLVCLPNGCLIVLAGYTGMGKTTWATDVGKHLALKGKHVIKFDLEMSPVVNAQRIVSAQMGVRHTDVLRGILSKEPEAKIIEALSKIGIDFVHLSRLKPSDIAMTIKQAWTKYDLVIIDYLQLMSPDGAHGNRNLEVASLTRELKAIAIDFDVPVMALSQLSRPTVRDKGLPMPALAMLRDSGAIEQDADMVAFIHRPSESRAVFRLAKNRIGPVGERDLLFDSEHVEFLDYHAGSF